MIWLCKHIQQITVQIEHLQTFTGTLRVSNHDCESLKI